MNRRKLSHTQIIALGFLLLILIGTLLLMTPIATQNGQGANFLTAIFTATSATCVTGLVIRDTAVYWSAFGQVVLLCLIQIGGLGFMTIATVFFRLLRRNMGLRHREIMVESLNATQVGGVLRLARLILVGTVTIECLGAVLLSIRFVPMYGWGKGLYYSIFHAVSAFCNAGFDLFGTPEAPFASLTAFSGDVLVNVTIMGLIVIGGLGFIVWEDLVRKGWRVKRYRLQSKIVLSATALLIFGGALLLFIMERTHTGQGRSVGEQWLAALFGAVTARTAGFNTVDTASLSAGSKLFTAILMFIGGSPGSTAGGVKTTTVVVLLTFTITGIRHVQGPGIFGRRLSDDVLKKSAAVFMTNLLLALCGILLLCVLQPLPLEDIMFEVFSAIGTVGMSTGITRELLPVSQVIIMLLMYLGRVGSVSFAMALMEKKARPPVTYPAEQVTIG